ncbi:Tetratricopeptide repeat protein 3 isoform 2-like protein [Camelus ferus]|nr:Tetratricopeptide repeat protein 3 isoform 2-like protein [Camelus ferus]
MGREDSSGSDRLFRSVFTMSDVVCRAWWCTMDDFALRDFTVADYALLEDCPYVDDGGFAPEHTSSDYVRVTQLYCDGVQGELMKMKGNEEFSKERFDIAIIYYTRAIECRNALGDGKRAIILKNNWTKDFANIMKMLRSLIQDGYTALLEQRCRSAAQAFTELLNGLDPQKIKELSEAENQFKRMIEHYPNEGLDCLAYCGIGKVYLKKNSLKVNDGLAFLQMLLEKFIEECRFPPVPDAICCYQKCHGYSKVQIYITDPDFKGFIRISCCQYCKIEFHMNCWKKLKTTTFNDKIDKDFLQGICLTPDCEGIISKIIIFSSGGQVKCEFEHKVIKEKVPPRPILKQKCSRNFLNEAVDYVIRHLIQEKNRVKTRVFLHVLSELKEVEPKLATWIQKLDGFGLDATGPFFSRYGASLKELDFSIMTFLWNEKYGHKLGSIEGKKLDYFCEPTSLKEARCLIWLLEEHRDKFPVLHNALDEFFDIMDSRCTVLRKQDSGDMPPMLVGSGTTSVTANNETVTSGEDHNKRNSNSAGPFVVPDHLRQDVEEFEALYEQHSSNEYVVRNKKLWDINPKQKCSTLYDYFSQLLEEHGPLDMSNKMFSEEYEFFPEETRQILEKAGGLKSFLLGCPRFVVIDNCIALKKVALRLKKKRKKKNIKTKVEEISRTGEYLRVKLPLNPTAREFKPDVKSKPVSDLSSAPASEDVKPKPTSTNSPQPACEAVKPKPISDNSSRSVSDDEKPNGVSSESPKLVSEEASHKQVSCNSPKPVPEDMKPTYWTQPHLVTGYCTYLPFRGFDITQTPPAFINVLPSLPQYSIYTPLANIPSEYQLQRSVPVVTSFVASDIADVHFEGQHFSSENAPGNQIASETQICQDSLEIPVKSPCITDDANTAQSESSRSDGHCGNSAKWEVNLESTNEVTDTPRTQMVAIQGDISQIEKEYQVLQEQLKVARENYEQRNNEGSEETRDLEEKLKRNIEENKISKTELDWFLEDLEKEIKKWQQEKKEIQERTKALKKKMKKVLNASEINTFTNEKMKIEECIKKGKEDYEESLRRAVDAEVSVLENWKETEVWKLQTMESQAEGFLKKLKLLGRDSVLILLVLPEDSEENSRRSSVLVFLDSTAYPDVESDTHSWKSFVSDVRKEMEKAEIHLELLPESSDLDAHDPSTSASHGAGNRTAVPKDLTLVSAAEGLVELPSCEPEVALLPVCESSGQAAQSKQSLEADQKLPVAPGRAARSSQSPKKPFNSIIEHLSVVFPYYSSTELAGFIKKVRNKNKNSLSGLSIDEIVQRVAEHILDEEKKKKPNPGKDKQPSELCSAASVTTATQDPPSPAAGASPQTRGQETEGVRVSGANSCEICHEVFKSKNVRVLECGHKCHKGVRTSLLALVMSCIVTGVF